MANSLSRVPVKTLVKQDKIQQMFEGALHEKATQFATSLVSVVNENRKLSQVDSMSVINSAMVAASLDLPINQNLGYMWLVPYKNVATPQIGYKGYIQLAMRTGQYKSLNAIVVYDGELNGWNVLTEEVDYNPTGKKSDTVIGYIGYFKLLNGFEKTVYWTRDQIDQHRQRFSKMSGGKKPSGVWESDFDAMALKTVLRNLLSKWGPMSTEMSEALTQDEKKQDSKVPVDIDAEEGTDTTAALLNDFNKAEGAKTVNADEKDGDTDDDSNSDSEPTGEEPDHSAQTSINV
ncbi:recombinase RecT [Levilactobacillus brevis]|uniref:recombinase RecT n=1 Tax=Levilactobacillus brevis TaxID=1580 RepID=UPI001BDF68BD|nr:recombinase RecT [Levilactobacillus brevis]